MPPMIPLRCACGEVEGELSSPGRAARATCYCRDCRAFAIWLGDPRRTFDAAGGTDIVATTPGLVRFTRGKDRLRCVCVIRRGLFRWYSDCCRSAIGSVPRDPKRSYVALVAGRLAATPAQLDAAFGASATRISTDTALRPTSPTPLHTLRTALKVVRAVGSARISGAWRDNPFFQPGTDVPIVRPRVLSYEERAALDEADG